MIDKLGTRRLEWDGFRTSEMDIASEVANRLVKEQPEIDPNKAYILALTAVRETTDGQGNMALYQGLITNAARHASKLYDER